MLATLLTKRPSLETAMSALDRRRLKLPVLSLAALYKDYASRPVTFYEMPLGPWSSPLADVAALAKIAVCARPKRLLEVGSYRGYTTLMLARHTDADARIVAVDRDPRHGEAYRGTEFADKVERRVAQVETAAFRDDAPRSYDLIFVDADHAYEKVREDTQLLLPLLAPNGIFVWHDYANWGRFSRTNGVPELLAELALDRPIAAIAGSWLAAHSPAWAHGADRARYEAACRAGAESAVNADPWSVATVRG
ncbi:class I SAM-dependent methyltransferase [Acuticoccus sp.]|uniref:class I SAM-dependent methyltransferase n=1 Tax=Acuticoccus sp. TaxID=1904378 RepID=UPI003B52AC1C